MFMKLTIDIKRPGFFSSRTGMGSDAEVYSISDISFDILMFLFINFIIPTKHFVFGKVT